MKHPTTHVDQVGGKHYQAEEEGLQHWDIMERYDVDYLLGNATKYLARWRKKGSARVDLGKAASYVEKALLCRPGQGARRLVPADQLSLFYKANAIHWMDGELISRLLASGSHADLQAVHVRIKEMEESAS